MQFFDVTKPSWGGTAEFVSDNGNVEFAAGSKVDVSAAAGGDAGRLIVRAANGTFTVADGSVQGQALKEEANGQRGEGARAEIDIKTLASFSALNTALNSGGFDGERNLRVRTSDIKIAAGDTVKAHDIKITADGGQLDVEGTLDASGAAAGRIELFAQNDVNVLATAQLKAVSSGANEDGGDIEIGTTAGKLDLVSGSTIDLAGGAGGQGGTLLLRASRIDNNPTLAGDDDVNITAVNSTITGARSVAVEAVKVYDKIGTHDIDTLVATGTSSGTSLSLEDIAADNTTFAGKHAAIKDRLETSGNPSIHVLSGVEVRAPGDLTLANDWNLSTASAGGEAGTLTLRTEGNLKVNSNLSDGFNVATTTYKFDDDGDPETLPIDVPAVLESNESWSYRLVAGADAGAANPLAVVRNATGGNVTLAAGKLIRTGTGDIRVAAGGNIELKDNKSTIYTAGQAADLEGFIHPVDAQFSQAGGDILLRALGDITSAKRSEQLYSNWLFRQGRLNADGTTYATQPAWWVRFDQFQQGVATLGGGDVTIQAGGQTVNLSASAATQARMASLTSDAAALVKTGGGSVRVETGGDLRGGQYYADNGELVIKAGGKLDASDQAVDKVGGKLVYTILALGDAQAKVQAQGDVNIHTVLNPHLVAQSSGSGGNVTATSDSKWSLFSSYSENSSVELGSLVGTVALHNGGNGSAKVVDAYKSKLPLLSNTIQYNSALLSTLPPSLSTAAFQGNVDLNGVKLILSPAARSNLTLLAAGSVKIPAEVTLSDMGSVPDATKPGTKFDAFNPALVATRHAPIPVHAGDTDPARVYAVTGDVTGTTNKVNLTSAKALWVKAGQDVDNLGLSIQHPNENDISRVEAGRDVTFTSGSSRTDAAKIWIGGPGRLEVTAGRDIDLGTSAGIVSRGDLDNVALSASGADIHVTAGVGVNGIDYAGAVDRLIAQLEAGAPDDASLWQARWLTGDDTLAADQALTAVKTVDMLSADSQRERVREMVFTALRATGRDSTNPDSPYAGDYARGYAALETVFPGIGEKNPDGSFKHYQGGVNLFASRILTARGGDVEFMAPGGSLIVGLSNTPNDLVGNKSELGEKINEQMEKDGVLGMTLAETGDIRGFSRDDILVNQSRILTVGGGDVLLWSSEGDIDAGKGKKTAAVVPPPLTLVDSQGNVTQVLQGAATGSGIAALQPASGTAGDVDLIAPKGTVNAGDAGIRAGNLNIAAAVVLGADNISVSGSSTGTPVADTSAVTAASSGATSSDGGTAAATAALSSNLADAARAAEELKQAFKPTFITAEVVGHGE
ncbi:MAG: filamentous hemagglutinin family protein [Thiobacillus sp.]|nr:filamentous hemagglutinin family protein [Thiobacillus sp.]